jgi:hypothetical protein
MSRISYLFALTLLLTSIATAQPMLVTEHDWTFRLGTARYGVCQWNIAPGDLNRHTTVYCGTPVLTLKIRAGSLAALVLIPLVMVGTLVVARRGYKRATHAHAA